MERDVGNAAGLGGGEIGAAGIAAIGGGLPRRCTRTSKMAIEHRHKALGIGRIAGFDDEIEDQSAFAGRQVEFVSVLNLTTAFDDDVGECAGVRSRSRLPWDTQSHRHDRVHGKRITLRRLPRLVRCRRRNAGYPRRDLHLEARGHRLDQGPDLR
jgi:hypothetical protein